MKKGIIYDMTTSKPQNKIEETLLMIWDKVLDHKIDSTQTNFFSEGGNSLIATLVISEIKNTYHVDVSFEDLLKNDSIEKLANFIVNQLWLSKQVINNKTLEKESKSIDTLEEESGPVDSLKASPQQSRMVLNQLFNPSSTAFNIPVIFQLTDQFDKNEFEDCLKEIIKKHQTLNINFSINEDGIFQKVQNQIIDVREIKIAAFDETLSSIISPFEIGKDSLIRLIYADAPSEKYLILDFHHSIIDGYSIVLLHNELFKKLSDEKIYFENVDYFDYCIWMEKYIHSPSYKKQEKFWLKIFENYQLIQHLKQKSNSTFEGDSIEFSFSKDLNKKIRETTKEWGISIYSFLLSMYAQLIHKEHNLYDFIIGTPVSGRTNPRFIKTIGMFINTLPIRVKINDSENYEQYSQRMNSNIRKMLENQDYQFDHLVEQLKKINPQLPRLEFETMFNYQNYSRNWKSLEKFGLNHITVRQNSEKFNFSMTLEEREDEILGCFSFNVEVLTRNEAKWYVEQFINICEEAVVQKDINTVTTLQNIEDTNIYYKIMENLSDFNGKTALVSYKSKVEYAELDQFVDNYVQRFKQEGIRKSDRIAIMMDRSIENVLVILAILKIGACYIPIDSKFPESRKKFILKDANCKYIVNNKQVIKNVEYEAKELDSSELNLAYIIYTSGSTGQPKGVKITQSNLYSFLKAISNRFSQYNYSSILCVTSISFDIFILETLFPIFMGKTCVFASDEEIEDISKLTQLIRIYQVDTIQSTPSRWGIFTEDEQLMTLLKERLKLVLVGGEKLTKNIAEKLLSIGGKLINLYGPTEATVWAFASEVTDPNQIYLGEPLNNTTAYILDENGKESPKGELCLQGSGVSPGYQNRPELTEKSFVKSLKHGNNILYHTGDIVEYTNDQDYLFIGRKDDQVKVNGYRVELGEIDSIISKMSKIKRAKTIYQEETGNLIAFCESKEHCSDIETRKELSKILPKYMLPNSIIFLSEMPLMINGKIDTSKLKNKYLQIAKKSLVLSENVEELSATQQHLIKIFKSVTGYALDRDENFFEVGISSLNILRVIQHLKKTYSVDYSNLVDYPTISSLSSYLDNLSEKKLVRKVNSDKDRTQISKINEREVLNVGRKGILLTGSTGFLGCHLLKELLKQKRLIHLLIRGKNVEDIYKRLAEKFYYYFSEDLAIYSSQLHFYCGDLEKVYCGLEESEFKKLCTQVSDVINSAASVKHFGKYEDFYKSNVISVKNLITFCKESQSALFHISTISLANICDLKANQSFSEEIILTNASTSNVYLQTKYEAEKTIFEAISEGLKANILRVGNIVGSSKTGIFQMNIEENAFYQILRSFFKLKMIPDSNEKSLEFTFVDECALAISEIINNKHLTGVYHIFNQNKISFNELFDFIKTQYPYLKKMTFSKIEETQGLKGTDAEEYFDIIKIHSSTANKNVAKIDNIFTNQLLDKYNFCWSRVDKKTILLLLEYCKEINFI